MKTNIAIIGGGNLGTALALGLAHASDKYNTTVTRRKIELIRHLEEKNITVSSDNIETVKHAELIILAVQPTQIEALIQEIKPVLNKKQHVLISVITGLAKKEIAKLAGPGLRIVRVMPNTAAAINQSMTCIANTSHTKSQKKTVELFGALGKTLIIEEELMQASTVLNACGIAFFLRYIRAASQGGIEVGFHADEAQLIATQTALGASALLLESGGHPEQEIDKVTTPKGCTIAGLNEMEHNGLSSALIKGIKNSYEKISKIR